MALFGKKEQEANAPGIKPPPIKKELPQDQKKVEPKNTATVKPKETSKETTYLGKNLKVNGNITGEGSLIVLGTFDGEFDIKGQVKVAQGAVINGNIRATGISVNGKVDGTILASEKILLDTSASIRGRLVTPKISIQDGAVFDGELQMSKKMDQPPKTAVPEATQPQKATTVSEIK